MKLFFIKKKREVILFFLFSLAIFLITFQFTDTPKVWIDEGLFTEIARNVVFHGVWGIQTSPGNFSLMNLPQVSVSYPVIFPVALSLKIFGTGIWQARLPMIIYMFVLAVLFYFFVKKRYGFYTGVLSVLILLSFSPFYGDGRTVLGEVPGLVFFVLGAWLLLLLEESDFRSRKLALLSGLAFGLAAATKGIYLLGVPLAFIISLIFWFTEHHFFSQKSGARFKQIKDKKILLAFILGFVPPVLIWAYIHLVSSNSLSSFIPNYLHLASNHSSSISLSQTILINFTRFFTESTPILFLFLLVAVAISFLFRFFKIKSEHFSIAECMIISFIVLNWIGYLGGTGWYRYFFPAHILLYLLFPGAVYILAKSTNNLFLKRIILVIPIVLIVFQFFHLIFLSDTSFTHNRTRNDELSAVLSKIDPSKKIFFYNTIEAVIFLKGDNYSQYFYCDGCFLEGGNKNSITDHSYDFILTVADQQSTDFLLSHYERQTIDKYFLFKKISK